MKGGAFFLVALLALLKSTFAGSYFPFSKSDWTVPSKFKVQLYYNGPSLGLSTDYGNLPKSRSMAVSGNSFLVGKPTITYVSTKGAASTGIYALVDLRNRGQADYATLIIKDTVKPPLGTGAPNKTGGPNGIAWVKETAAGGSLYFLVSEYFVANRLFKVEDIDSYALSRTTVPATSIKLIRDDFPHDSWHGWRYIRFDSAKNLYVAIGANCNICNVFGTAVDNGSYYNNAYDANVYNMHNIYQKNASTAQFQFATIYKFTPPYTAVSGSGIVKYAAGVRNTVGFDFYPGSTKLYFTDNGADDIGGTNMNITRNMPECELNYAATVGANYGFPFCHTGAAGNNPDFQPYLRPIGIGNDIPDPFLNPTQAKLNCAGTTYKKAIQAMGPHVAALGMRFYKSVAGSTDKTNFPSDYWNNALIAQRGSWDRDWAIGARVMRVKFGTAPTVTGHFPFLTGGVPADTGLPNGPIDQIPGSQNKTIQNWRGRPVDIEYLPDSTILVSDDEMGAIYRVTYCGTTPSWGVNARYGVGRCGGVPHSVTADKLKVGPRTVVGAPSLANGCAVNLGTSNVSYVKCAEYDLSGRGAQGYIAYNLRRINTSLVVMDGAFVASDYQEVNGNGWVAFSVPPNGIGNPMVGAQALISTPSPTFTSAGVSAYRLGTGAAGVAGLTASTGFIAAGTSPSAVMAGNALVTTFSINLPLIQSTTGGNLSTMLSYGDMDSVTGAIKQHWVIALTNLTIALTDVDRAPADPSTLPLVNPSVAALNYEPACPATKVTETACAEGDLTCLNGVTYDSVTLISNYPGTSINFYFKLNGNILSIGTKSTYTSAADGYAVLSVPNGDSMLNNDAIFIRKSASLNLGATQAVNYLLDGSNGYQPLKPSNCTYTNIKVVDASPASAMVSSFDINWPGSNALRVRVGGGAYPGGTGIDGMSKHPNGAAPYYGCIYRGADGLIKIKSSATVKTWTDAGWTALCMD